MTGSGAGPKNRHRTVKIGGGTGEHTARWPSKFGDDPGTFIFPSRGRGRRAAGRSVTQDGEGSVVN